MRVADDLGKHKTAFKILNKPVFGMKGSYVITKVKLVQENFISISKIKLYGARYFVNVV